MSTPAGSRPGPPVTPLSEVAAAEVELDSIAGTDVETQPERYGAVHRRLQKALDDAETRADKPPR